jgi:hypothetical protein
MLFPILTLNLFTGLLLEWVGLGGRVGRLWARLGQGACVELIPEESQRVRLVERGGGATVEGIVEL